MRRLIAAALALVSTAACIPPPEDNDRIINYKLDTAMGVIQERGTLYVGLEYWYPFADRPVGPYKGFAVDYARDIAEALGVEPHFAAATRDRLLDGVRAGDFDIAFPLVPITEELARRTAVTDPYYVGHTHLLTKGKKTGGPVCQLSDPSPSFDIEALSVEVIRVSDEECLHRLSTSKVRAVAARDVQVIGLLHGPAEVLLDLEQHSTEGYGALVRKDPPGLAAFVDAVLAEAKAEGRWTEWYERWIDIGVESEPPDMTAEEAAALFPVEQ